MRNCTILLCTLILICISIPLTAQQTGDPEKAATAPSILGSNAEGTHFIVGFMQNEENTSICALLGQRSLPQHRIAVASRFQTVVTLIYPDGRQVQRQIQPFQVSSFTLNGEEFECLGEGICDKSFEVISDQPVCVYCFSTKPRTSDGYLALPTSSWGTEYYTANYFLDMYTADPMRDPNDCNSEPRGGEFAVIAGEDSTVVSLWPKERTLSGLAAGAATQKVLKKGEIWQVQDGGDVRGGSDLTGSYITANKPVGLLSGHVRTGIPWSLDTKDHLIEMIPPKIALGINHVIVPYGGRRGGDIVRVIASEAGRTAITVTTKNSRVQYLTNGAGSFQELLVSEVTVIETDKPVLVSHYSQSNGIDPDSNFDPYMIVTTPTEQFVNSAIFQTQPNGPIDRGTGKPQFDQHFVTLVIEKANYGTMVFNGQPLATHPSIVASGAVPILNNEYVWVTLRLTGGLSYAIDGRARFGGYVYGIGEFDSYGWPVGAGLYNTDHPDETAPKLTATPECGKQWYNVVITDSGQYDRGLSDVWLDRSASFNVDTLTSTPCVCGTNVYYLQIHLVDPDQTGKASIIARDNAGNLDTIDLDLYAVKPEFSRDSILILKGEIGKLRQEDLSIINPSTGEWIKIDSVRLKRGIEFKIVGLGSGDIINKYLVAGESYKLTISFRANQDGVYHDTLLVYIDCREYKIPLTATMAVPMIDTKDVDFGAMRIGRLKCLEVPVTNTGEGTLRIHEVRINGKRGAFLFDKNGVPSDTIELEPGETKIIIVCFEPDAVEDFTGKVEFISNAAAGKSTSNLTGQGIYPSITIGGYDFGAVQVGDTACSKVPVANTGSDTAFLTGVTIADNVFVDDSSVFPYALPPGDTLWISLCFTPGKEGDFSSPIGANNNDGLEAVASLAGSAYQLLAEIDGYDWGQRWVGTDHDTIVHVRNLTKRPIRIDTLWIANGDDGDFTILSETAPGVTLGPDEQYPVSVRFTPLVRGARSVGIYAGTSSRLRPVVENLLEGFAIQALPGDELVHDSSLMNSCDSRISRVLIYNRGNAPLTLNTVYLSDPTGFATLNAPNPGYQIPIGDDPLELEVIFSPAGNVGRLTETIMWSFEELPGEEYSRTVSIETKEQQYAVLATAPPRVNIGEEFNLFVGVTNALWKNIPQNEVVLEIRYNPTVTIFDKKAWEASLGNTTTSWSFVGAPEFPDTNLLRLTLHPTNGTAIPLEGTTFPAIPFRGFLGNKELDTFAIACQIGSTECVLPVATTLPYSIEQICGLQNRLLEFIGDPPALKEGRPNPASATVDIEFTLPFEGVARLELFSLDGKRIRRIIDGSMPSGNHIITVDVRELTNGVYYYRLEYGSFSASQPLLIRR